MKRTLSLCFSALLIFAVFQGCGGETTPDAPVDDGMENNDPTPEPDNEPKAEICDNEIDDDADGLTDCADVVDCEEKPACWDMTAEECGNGLDDDGNGDIDCDDVACSQEPACACGETAIDGLGLFEDTTAGASRNEGSCGGADGPDVAFLWTAPEAGNYTFDTLGSEVSDTVLYLRDEGCLGEEIACNDDIRFAEICNNEADDDGDGDTDCDDPDCASASFCLDGAPEDCYNDEDDDDDELADCEDPDCAQDPRCRFRHNALTSIVRADLDAGQTILIVVDGYDEEEVGGVVVNINLDQPTSEAGLCDDVEGFDEDRDGFINCTDPDCIDDPICDVDCPGTDIGSALGEAAASGSTDPEDDGPRSVRNHHGQCGGANTSFLSGGRNAPEDTFLWTAPNNGLYTFDTLGSDYDTILYLREGACSEVELACNDDHDGENEVFQSSVEVELTVGQQITIFVDGFAYASGSYLLNIDGPEAGGDPEEICDNEIDDDEDELADCDDPDCAEFEGCNPQEICDNEIDDDEDELADCDDPDCAEFEGCN